MEEIPSVSLRPATLEDLPAVMRVEIGVHVAPWRLQDFEAEVGSPHGQFWVLTDDETDQLVMGYVVFREIESQIQILNLAVPLEARGLGYGKRLLQEVLKHALRNSVTKIFLEVRVGNQAALQLYQNMKFFITHRRVGFYSDGEDAYVMELPLNETLSF